MDGPNGLVNNKRVMKKQPALLKSKMGPHTFRRCTCLPLTWAFNSLNCFFKLSPFQDHISTGASCKICLLSPFFNSLFKIGTQIFFLTMQFSSPSQTEITLIQKPLSQTDLES